MELSELRYGEGRCRQLVAMYISEMRRSARCDIFDVVVNILRCDIVDQGLSTSWQV